MNEHPSPDERLDELTSALPREIAPPPELWSAIRAELAPRSSREWRWGNWRLAAAALLIAASSSLVTVVALKARERARNVATVHVASAPSSSSSVATTVESPLPAQLASREEGYLRSAEALRRALDERRDSLAPSTVATVERSLRIADSAIAEARAALERDPSNAVLAALFRSNYERKLDVLRRATELAPRT
jgi:hypothetical protein